jgi:serine/threonine protein kinase
MIATGTTLQQRYRIDKQIGQGGMGAVYIATDERFGSTVAIKETLCMDDNFRKAIEREARLLNSLKHYALPRVSDHFEEENGQFLVMEYIAGDDVAGILERDQKPFEVDQVLKWADHLLDALEYLHNQDNPVIHRDIKPQNLKITPRGEIILLDFGLAKGNPTDAGHHTAAKSIFGYSRSYASLEQIQGTGTDPRSDLYSLAATLYHLLTNTPPEDALTRAMAVLSQRPDPLVPASEVNPAVPRGVAGVLQKSMALNADERPRSAAEMRDMLKKSGDFAYMADPVTVATNTANTSVFGKQTRLMPEGTQADGTRGTEAKTEVLPAYASQLTSVHGQSNPEVMTQVASGSTTFSGEKSGRFKYVAAGALALLLGFGGVLGGIYMLDGDSEGGIRTDTPAVPAANSTAETIADTSNTESPAEPAASEQSRSTAAPGSHQSQQPTSGQPSRQGDNEPAATTRVDPNAANDPGDMDLDNVPDVKVETKNGQMVITQKDRNGKVTTTAIPMPKTPFGAGGVPVKPVPGAEVLPRGNFDPRTLTPHQKQILREMMRRNAQRSAPPPTPTPPANRPLTKN